MLSIRRQTVVILALFLVVAGMAEATLYLYSGQDSFNVRVTNRWFKDVQDARGRVWVSGTMARIEVEAPGYRQGHTTVTVSQNTHQYYAQVQLDDPTAWVNLVDENFKRVDGYTNAYSQSMYWGDEFGMTARFAKKGFEKLEERRIQARVNAMTAWAPRVYLRSVGDSWDLEVVVRRRDMNQYSNTIDLVIPRDPPAPEPAPAPASAENVAALVQDYQDTLALRATFTKADEIDRLQARLESVARRLRTAARVLDAGERASLIDSLPEGPLVNEIRDILIFEGLHR